MSDTRRFDSLERVVRDTRRLLDDTSGTVLARLGTHTHPGGGGGGTTPDATTTVKGILQLAGDLAGTAAAPTVPGLAGKAATAHTHAYQPIDSDLTDIAALSPSDGTFLKRVASAWNAAALVKGDVGLGNADNTSDAAKPVSTATQTALNAKSDTSHTHPGGGSPDATTTTKGIVKLAGDLAGTADLPTVPGLDGKAPLGLDSEEAYVGTLQSTTSLAFTDLTTVGPTCVVTLATARRVLIFLKAMLRQTTTTPNRVLMSVAGTGATVAAAGDAAAVIHNGSGQAESYAGIVYLDCAAGTTTFTAKYRVVGGTGSFQDRFMVVIPV